MSKDDSGGPETKKSKADNALKLAGSINGFTADLYKELYKIGKGPANLIMSAYSVHVVLGMVSSGARGNTRAEILKGLKIPNGDDGAAGDNSAIGNAYHPVVNGLKTYKTTGGFTLITANRIYSQNGFPINPVFLDNLKEKFGVEMEQLDFSLAENAAQRINTWVAQNTNDKIKKLVVPDDLGELTRLVLVNAIYFNGAWRHTFKKQMTSKQRFYLTPTEYIQADLMRITKELPYVELEALNARAVALPYRGGRMSMIIVLPLDDINGLAKIQEYIETLHETANNKSKLTKNMKDSTLIELSLPRFKIETGLDNLKDMLTNLGMQTMFDRETADFTGILENGNNKKLYVSKIIQKAYIEVNERGTAVHMKSKASTGSKKPKIIPFKVDRPFGFQIVDHENEDMVIFSGHCSDPSK